MPLLCDGDGTMKLSRPLRIPCTLGLLRAGLAALVLSLLAGPAGAQGDEAAAGFQGYLQYLAAKARAEGVREQTIASVMAGLTEN
ncbi:MAG: hypothetical protein K2X68_00635, partial [Novosphingobium sp.]|nr:hypothetical protein [Novosphingobium sp.]